MLTEAKESWRILLDHGLHLVDLNGDVPAKQWVSYMLQSNSWRPETIALFLCRQGKGGLPIQNLSGCLHGAIHGSIISRQHELKEASINLVKGGADVYARDNRGRTVSEIACCKKTRWYHGSRLDITRFNGVLNRDLRLKDIWMDVLSECGYDPDEVISASVRVEELSDSDTDSSSDLDGEISSSTSDCSEGDNDSTSDEEGESDVAAGDVIARQPDAVTPHHYESLLLEGDAEVWSC